MFIPPWFSYQPDNFSVQGSAFMVFFNVAGNNETYLGLHVKFQVFCPHLTTYEISQQNFIKVPHTKFHRNPSTGRHTDTMNIIGALQDYANTPTNCSLSIATHLSVHRQKFKNSRTDLLQIRHILQSVTKICLQNCG
jgi:hypothetical protein